MLTGFHYPGFPRVGPTGSEITEVSIETDSRWDKHVRAFAPTKPEQEYDVCDWECDEDGEEYPVNWRTVRLTDEEYAAALAAWEKAMVEFRKTGGIGFTRGPTTATATVTCEDGTSAEAVFTGHRWRWVSWAQRSPK